MEPWITAIIVVVSILLFVIILFLLGGIKIALEYERLVIFRLGRYVRTIGPGLVYITPFLEKARKVDMRNS